MAKRLRPIGHEDRLSVVDHLDELRHRLIICAAVLAVAFGFCFWQSTHILRLLNKSLPPETASGRRWSWSLTASSSGIRDPLALPARIPLHVSAIDL